MTLALLGFYALLWTPLLGGGVIHALLHIFLHAVDHFEEHGLFLHACVFLSLMCVVLALLPAVLLALGLYLVAADSVIVLLMLFKVMGTFEQGHD